MFDIGLFFQVCRAVVRKKKTVGNAVHEKNTTEAISMKKNYRDNANEKIISKTNSMVKFSSYIFGAF